MMNIFHVNNLINCFIILLGLPGTSEAYNTLVNISPFWNPLIHHYLMQIEEHLESRRTQLLVLMRSKLNATTQLDNSQFSTWLTMNTPSVHSCHHPKHCPQRRSHLFHTCGASSVHSEWTIGENPALWIVEIEWGESRHGRMSLSTLL